MHDLSSTCFGIAAFKHGSIWRHHQNGILLHILTSDISFQSLSLYIYMINKYDICTNIEMGRYFSHIWYIWYTNMGTLTSHQIFFSPNAMAPPCAGLWTSECLDSAEREPGGRGDVAVSTTEARGLDVGRISEILVGFHGTWMEKIMGFSRI